MNCNDTAAKPAIRKNITPGLEVMDLQRAGLEETHITVIPLEGESHEAMFQRAAALFTAADAPYGNYKIVTVDVFGVATNSGAFAAAFGKIEWPVTWLVDGDDPLMAGVQIWAISGVEVQPVLLDGKIVGSLFEDEFCRYCRLGGMQPTDGNARREIQARETLERMEKALASVDMVMTQIVRTWFYNHDLLDWYFGFNKVRDGFFAERGLYEQLVPASTGIGGTNPDRLALTSGLLAMDKKTDGVDAFALTSPLQCAALEYGSSFSRAAEIVTPDCRRIFISGTASIEPGGKTVHLDDTEKQIDLTMRVAGAILESRDMNWSDVSRAIVYIRNAEDKPLWEAYSKANGLEDMPTLIAHNVVCRDDLLFEIEADAIKTVE